MTKHRGLVYVTLLFTATLLLAACATSSAPAPATPEPATSVEGRQDQEDRSAPGTTASPSAAPASPQAPAAQAITAPASAVSGQNALAHVQALEATIGSRPAGSAAEKQAADYLTDQYRSLGYEVRQQPFEFDSYDARSTSLTVNGEDIENNVVYFSPGGEVSAPLVMAGIGRPEEFPSEAKDAIVLVERGTLRFGAKVANAAAAGAAGVIIYNNASGSFEGTLGRLGQVPVVGVSQEAGQQLADLLSSGSPQVRLEVDAGRDIIKSQNVVAQGDWECRIVIGGHYDSVPAGPGANDNASGTAVTLELARVLKDEAEKAQLCFIAFGGEELGLWGSRRYVESLSSEQKSNVVGMVNLDMVGVGDAWRLYGTSALNDLASEAAEAAGQSDLGMTTSEGRFGGSDHVSFMREGIQSVFIHRVDDPNYHTADDKVEFLDADALETAGQMALEVVTRLSAQR